MTEKLRETGARLRRSVGQEEYTNGGGISRKDAYKLATLFFLALLLGALWEGAGFALPSDEVWSFARRILETALFVGAAAAGVHHARRKKP